MSTGAGRIGVRPPLVGEVTVALAESLDRVATIGLRGEATVALRQLEALAEGPHPGADLIAIAELATVLGRWTHESVTDLIDGLLVETESPNVRGALLFQRGRSTPGEEHIVFLNRALEEFAVAGSDRGRAVTLAALARSGPSPLGVEHRGRLAREALRLAHDVGERWAISWCAGQLARYETFSGDRAAATHWKLSSEELVDSIDLPTIDMLLRNLRDYALYLAASGELAPAEQLLHEGLTLVAGSIWRARFFEGLSVVYWRMGRTREALAAAETQLAIDPGSVMALLVRGAHEYESAAHPETSYADRAVENAIGDERWAAIALQARLRQVRGEPEPLRDLWPVIGEIPANGSRFGWEELIQVAIIGDAERTRDLFAELTASWPPHIRGQAIQHLATGLLEGSHAKVLGAAEGLLELGESRLAASALYAAARLAPTVVVGNQLRRRALALFKEAEAERSLAMVLRDRTLRRDASVPRIPHSQRFATNAGLTERQRDVAELAARGLTAQEIADELGTAVSTVRHHLLKVRRHFGNVPKRRLAQLLTRREDD